MDVAVLLGLEALSTEFAHEAPVGGVDLLLVGGQRLPAHQRHVGAGVAIAHLGMGIGAATVRQTMLRNDITLQYITIVAENTKYALRVANPEGGQTPCRPIGCGLAAQRGYRYEPLTA
jgi:hypothetical protein